MVWSLDIFIGKSRHFHWKVSTCSLESLDMFLGKSRHVYWKVSTCSLENLDIFIGKSRYVHWKASTYSLESLDMFIGKSRYIHWKNQGETNSSQRWFIKRRFAGYDFHHHLGHHMILFACLFHHLRGNVIYLLHFPCKLWYLYKTIVIFTIFSCETVKKNMT